MRSISIDKIDNRHKGLGSSLENVQPARGGFVIRRIHRWITNPAGAVYKSLGMSQGHLSIWLAGEIGQSEEL